MFLLLIVLAVIFCVVILYLPYAAGLTTVEKAKHTKEQVLQYPVQQQRSGYIPPDEEARIQQERSGKNVPLRERVKVTNEDMPIRIGLKQDSHLRKRGAKIDVDRNPNNYDYDLDELIRDETEGEAKRAAEEYNASQKVEGTSEDLV